MVRDVRAFYGADATWKTSGEKSTYCSEGHLCRVSLRESGHIDSHMETNFVGGWIEFYLQIEK